MVGKINTRAVSRKREESREYAPDSAQVWRIGRLTREGTAEQSRETRFSGANGDKVKNHFPCSADHEQDLQPYPV